MNMTNKQKAEEIIGVGCNRQNCSECGGGLSVAEGCVEFRHLKEMAEWKEKEMLDCAVSAYCECCDTKECEEDYWDLGGECNWKLKFEKKLLKNLKK